MTWGEAANLAVNQTLMRSINTSVIALLPVAGLLFVGAGLLGVGTLKDLALVLFVGLAAGAYSSIFLATPIVADLKEREPEVHGAAPAGAWPAARRRPGTGRAAGAGRPGRQRPPGAAGARPASAVAERGRCRDTVEADVVDRVAVVRAAASPAAAATAAPRPGARPQRPGADRPSPGKKRR